MYTQCPQCHTLFALKAEQLAACNGSVRCGSCWGVFRADHYVFDTLPATVPEQQEIAAVRLRPSAPAAEEADTLPVMTDPPWASKRRPRRWSAFFWTVGSLLLALLLPLQYAYHFRSELALDPRLKPWLVEVCALAGCDLPPFADIAKIELLDARVVPHPQVDNALSIEAELVNQARFAQACPLLEVSLTDSRGEAVARRVFAPAEYLGDAALAEQGMPPRVTLPAAFAITQPSGAVGYEIRLLAPP